MSRIGLCCWAPLFLSLIAVALGMMNGGVDMDLVDVEGGIGVNMNLESCEAGTPGCFDFVQSLETIQPCCECRSKDDLNPYNCPDYFQGPAPPSAWTTVKWSEWDGKNEYLDADLPVEIPCGLEVWIDRSTGVCTYMFHPLTLPPFVSVFFFPYVPGRIRCFATFLEGSRSPGGHVCDQCSGS